MAHDLAYASTVLGCMNCSRSCMPPWQTVNMCMDLGHDMYSAGYAADTADTAFHAVVIDLFTCCFGDMCVFCVAAKLCWPGQAATGYMGE